MAQQTLERVTRSVAGYCGICRTSDISSLAKSFVPAACHLELRLLSAVAFVDEKRRRMQVIRP
jgi:hypothetical protein